MKSDTIRIGVGDSKLEVAQANLLKMQISELGLRSELVNLGESKGFPLKSNLTAALLASEIDLWINNYKAIQKVVSSEILCSSVGSRLNPNEVLIKNRVEKNIIEDSFIIGVSSAIQKAQWKSKYPNTQFETINKSLPVALEQLWDSVWDGIIVSSVDLQLGAYIGIDAVELEWMVPEAMKGGLGILYLKKNRFVNRLSHLLKDADTDLCLKVECQFKAEIDAKEELIYGAQARIRGSKVYFQALSFDKYGRITSSIRKYLERSSAQNQVKQLAKEFLETGFRSKGKS